MLWHEFERVAPDLAALGRERIERFDCVMIGTLTRDGSPRVNPVEAYIVEGHLLMNMMPQSFKALDLLRDPRLFVHTLITSKEGGEGEFKIRGRALPLTDGRLRDALDNVFDKKIQWRPPRDSHYFDVDVQRIAFVRYADGEQERRRWPPP